MKCSLLSQKHNMRKSYRIIKYIIRLYAYIRNLFILKSMLTTGWKEIMIIYSFKTVTMIFLLTNAALNVCLKGSSLNVLSRGLKEWCLKWIILAFLLAPCTLPISIGYFQLTNTRPLVNYDAIGLSANYHRSHSVTRGVTNLGNNPLPHETRRFESLRNSDLEILRVNANPFITKCNISESFLYNQNLAK